MKIHNIELRPNATINHVNLKKQESSHFTELEAQGKIWLEGDVVKVGSDNKIVSIKEEVKFGSITIAEL